MSSFCCQVKSIFKIILFSYGFWYGLSGIFFNFTVLGLLPAVIILLAIYTLRIPQPSSAQVEQIIGKSFDDDTNCNVLITTVAHRGAGLDAPENSLIAFKMCGQKGCMFIEFDITLTKDAVPVVFHDENLERVANDRRIIAECNWEDLKNVDISVTHPLSDRFRGTCIPTLDQTITQLLKDKQRMFIDIKNHDFRMVKVVLDLFREHPSLYKCAIVTTFFPTIIYSIRKSNPSIVCSMAYRPYFFSHKSYSFLTGPGPRRASTWYWHICLIILNEINAWALPRITYYMLGLSLILLHKDCVSGEVIEKWRNKNVRVCVWSINQLVDKQYFSRSMKITYLTDTLVGESSVNLAK